MNNQYREEHYRIGIKNRLDGICITLEYGNNEYHTLSERVNSYRLFIDYNGQDDRQNTVFFRDGTYVSGILEKNLLQSIQKHKIKLWPKSRNIILECLLSLNGEGAIVDVLEANQDIVKEAYAPKRDVLVKTFS